MRWRRSVPANPQRGRVGDNLRGCNLKMLFYLLSVCMGSASYGYSALTPTYGFANVSVPPISIRMIYIMGNVFYAGSFFGALAAGWIADWRGRKMSICIGATITLLGTAVLAGSVDPAMYTVVNSIVGIGAGILLVSVPLWIAETVPPRSRGVFVTVHAALLQGASSSPEWIAIGFRSVFKDKEWRAAVALGCLWPLICLVCTYFFVPETPRYLIMTGQKEQAWAVLKELHSKKGDVDHKYTRLEFDQISDAIDEQRSSTQHWRQLFTQRNLVKRTIIGCGLNFFALSTGISFIAEYYESYVIYLGLNGRMNFLLYWIWPAMLFACTSLSLLIVDRLSRPSILFLGFAGCVISLVPQTIIPTASVTFSPHLNPTNVHQGLAFIYLFGFCNAVFLAGPLFFYTVEIFPNAYRAKGMALAMATYSAMNLTWEMVNMVDFGPLDNQGRAFIIFIVLNAVAAILIWWRKLPDTRRIPLEEIAKLFDDDTQNREENVGVAELPCAHIAHEMPEQIRSAELSTERIAEVGGTPVHELADTAIFPGSRASSHVSLGAASTDTL